MSTNIRYGVHLHATMTKIFFFAKFATFINQSTPW